MVGLHLFAFITGICYRLAEIEYIWANATWMYNLTPGHRMIKIRNWVTPWLKGDIRPQTGFWFYFHRFTFSFFEDGYHFFGNLPTVILFIATPLYYFMGWAIAVDWTVLLLLTIRWVGMELTLKAIVKEVE